MADCEKCLFYKKGCTRTTINRIDGYCWLFDGYEGEELKRVICANLWKIGYEEDE